MDCVEYGDLRTVATGTVANSEDLGPGLLRKIERDLLLVQGATRDYSSENGGYSSTSRSMYASTRRRHLSAPTPNS